ncbi:hypothetical protein ASC80_17660 [Afipia sp. Root123D2]|uniref:DUF3108 domain-containing protein n=1 Tax=Afipia sp. Root123D2 TaxID=1736436 RepID=UPI0006F3EA8F|nr:DUF3108 domain-containing protein [Afipia sp. Root123D2]KQW19241.1 hypothetical protein ASC80_17660 [Afipia sp. Root123D2]
MSAFSIPRRALVPVLCASGILVAGAAAGPASAQGQLNAAYEVSLGGLVIGKGNWAVAVTEDTYSAAVNGRTTGLLASIGGGSGTATAQGRMTAGQFVPVSYVTSILYGKKHETIRMTLANGNIKESSITPEPPVNPDRIPVTEAHRQAVIDPMTGSLLRVAGTGNPVGPEACRNKVSIFDGRMRYDLRLEYRRMETITAKKGYHGPAVVCGVFFTPVSGYVPDRFAIKYLAERRDMEITFAPIAGTRVLAPFRIKIPTPIGAGLVEATEFSSVAATRTAKTN